MKFGLHYIYGDEEIVNIKWFFKARMELTELNKYDFKKYIKLCSLCKRNEEEDAMHFVSRCPVFNDFRKRYFGKMQVDEVMKYFVHLQLTITITTYNLL